jgi:DinB superfamily
VATPSDVDGPAAWQRPDPSEHSAYYGRYIALVPEGDLFAVFDFETTATRTFLEGVSEVLSLHRYAAGKWSLRETFVHVTDAERIFGYRAMRFARGDQTELPGFEPDDYVLPSGADERSWRSIVEEYAAVRAASLAFYRGLPAEAWSRSGLASGARVSVRALAYITLGHDIHHRTLARERYLQAASA